jgi:uncharacterized protein YbjT (DUF2867 family)
VVFGPDDQFLTRFGALARRAPVLPLIGGGQTRFQPVWVGDVAAAIMSALETPAAGRVFELGGPRVYTFEDLLRLIQRAIGRRRRLVTLSWSAAERLAGLLERVPFGTPALTRDQIELLRRDNIVGGTLPGLAELGVGEPASVEVMVPSCLGRFVAEPDYDMVRRVVY